MRRRDLVQSLADLAEDSTRGGIATDFALEGRLENGSDELDVQLFRIAQEAVGNARKHGHATQVHLTLRVEPEHIQLRVEDNGHGFVPDSSGQASKAGEHLGLLSMRERAERLRGRLSINSAPGHGTIVEATVPVPSE
jgi:signal transduction histidine kinase